MSAPVLFLDIDGVLNHWGTEEQHNGFVGIDPSNVAHLNAICAAVPEMRIVVSSTWRLLHSRAEVLDALNRGGFRYPDRVVGSTPDLYGPDRGLEIQRWIDDQPEPPSRIAILDDNGDMAHLLAHLVQTDMNGGLTERHAEQVIAKLSPVAEAA